jgi:tetraprenyl-beta-curcumene synthase
LENYSALSASSIGKSDQAGLSGLAPLLPRTLSVLARAVTRELLWALPAVAREEKRWRGLARKIPHQPLREDALSALSHKRGQADGAALFTILPSARSPPLLRLLVAYQIIWDYLDSVHERAPEQANGRQLHLALLDALDPGRERADYYRHHPWRDDGGYLNALVDTCRECCVQLPRYDHVRPLVLAEARRAQVLALNHEMRPVYRDATLKEWAHKEFPSGHEAQWFELSAACSAGLTIFALLALAADAACDEAAVHRTHTAYFPWVSATATMLDSYVDEMDDAESGDHIYVAHYPTPALAIERIGWLLRRCLHEVSGVRDREKHVLIVASMTALYLSKDSARTPATRENTRTLAMAGGSLTRVLIPVLRLWRILYAVRST